MRRSVVFLAIALLAVACGESQSAREATQLPDPTQLQLLWRRSAQHYPGRHLSVAVLSPCAIWTTGMEGSAWSCGGDSLLSLPMGEGPGEFIQPWLAAAWGPDSVAIWDARLRRLSILAADGSLGRVVALPISAEQGRMAGIFHRDTTLRVWTNPFPLAFGNTAVDSVGHVWALRPGEANPGTALVSFPGPRSTIIQDERTFSRVDAPVRRKPLVVALADGTLLVGSTGSDTVTVHDWNGAVLDTLVLGLPSEPVTSDDRSRYADSVRKSFRDELAGQQLGAELNAFFLDRAEQIIDAAEWPATRQRLDLIAAGQQDEFWALMPGFGIGYEREWRAYRSNGSVRARYHVPHAGSVRAAAVTGDTLTTLEVQFFQDTVSLAQYVVGR
ncbi:MAG TPA: hypothetical protein VFS94_01365 [Gemmatimonadales bacterium]|nr:hypothetical protein [Gemmatimonadales bacterium]